LDRLIEEEDTDGDRKITVEDTRSSDNGKGDKHFWIQASDQTRYEVVGTYYLSNLLQELTLARDQGLATAPIASAKIFESPVNRLSRTIREVFWDGLTRRLDKDHLEQVLSDEKMDSDAVRYLYVSHSDETTYSYFSNLSTINTGLKLQVKLLPAEVTPDYVRSLDGKHGLLSLALTPSSDGGYEGVPFVVPGGRFNEMYGWDSYFEDLGLLADNRVDLAKAMVDNFVYQITHYGKILNANRTYYLTRSQPPFLTSMALAVYEHEQFPKNGKAKAWLKTVFQTAIKEYFNVWMNKDRLTDTGLSRYYGSGIGQPPEVEEGHFDAIYQPYVQKQGMTPEQFEESYKAGEIRVPELDTFFVHDRCVRESGHDTTYRWNWNGDRCADFNTVDLNSLLYKIELDIARTIEKEFHGSLEMPDGRMEKSATWRERAKTRKALIRQYLWDEKESLFFDYDFAEQKARYKFISATAFYPLWAWDPDDPGTQILAKEEARNLIQSVGKELEMPGGIAGSSQQSRGPLSESRPARQWDYPNGWAPHQMLIWRGLLNYGFHDIAHRLIYRWLYTITRNAVDYNGTVPEKYDVVKRSHQVFAEYGNVGTKFDYITKEGFGWMNASYQVGLDLLPAELRIQLDQLVPPEWIFRGLSPE